MSRLDFTNADVAQLLKIQEDIKEAIKKYRENTPAIVPAVACARICQGLLSVYTPEERKEVVETVIVPFLLGEKQMRGKAGRSGPRRSNLILPPGFKLN